MSETYRDRGVSAEKEDVHRAIRASSSGEFAGAFCKIVADASGDPAYVSLLHADGAGTKALVAYLMYKESGSARFFRGIAQDSAVMNIDDMLCVGAVGGFLLSNTIGRNAHRIDGSVLEAIIEGYEEVAATLAAHGVSLRTTGGETADVGDLVQTIIVDSTVYARMRRDDVIDGSGIRAGHCIVGLSSAGRAAYESQENSGIGSNGLTLARHVLIPREYGERYPESFSSTLKPEHVYGGKRRLDESLPGSNQTVGAALLSPTRTYAPVIKRVLEECREEISGIIHCTGGGQTKCRNFGRGLHYVKHDLFEMPPVFRVIRDEGKVADREMYQVFNMGHRMELMCDPSVAERIVAIAGEFAIDAKVVGDVRKSEDGENRVTIVHEGEDIVYR